MSIHFWKMHGAANDFILVDDRQQTFPLRDRKWLEAIMARRTGIGSEGILLIQPSDKADFRMRFFNPDGGEADMCGNGARCIARLAHDLHVAPMQMKFETAAGMVGAEIRGENVLLQMTEPRDWRLNRKLTVDGRTLTVHSVNTGVPHAVVEVDDLDAVDVPKLGAAVRYHPDFAPAGTNANFIRVTGPNTVRVRTYERGVEGETLACGTGIVASGLVAGRLGRVKPPVRVIPASGDKLEVDYQPAGEGLTAVTLLGPAVYVFEGELAAG